MGDVKKGHLSTDLSCPTRKAKCDKCGLIGHFARKCKTKNAKRKPDEYGYPKQRRLQTSRVRCIEEKDSESERHTRNFDCIKINDTATIDEMPSR